MGYDLADPVPLSVNTRDATGALANAGSISLTVTHAGTGTNYSLTPTNPSTGVYQATFVPSLSGYHKVRWIATGVNSSGYSDAFHVYDPTPNYLVSLVEARALLRLTSTAQDEDLRQFMEGVTEVVEDHRGETIVPRMFVEDYESVRPGRGGASISLLHVPVISVQSIVSVTGLYTWNVADFHIDKTTGLITSLPSSNPLYGDVTVAYQAGMSVIPMRIQNGARIIIQHAWQTRRGAAGAPLPAGMGDTTHLAGRLGWGYAIPNAALEWLGVGQSAFA